MGIVNFICNVMHIVVPYKHQLFHDIKQFNAQQLTYILAFMCARNYSDRVDTNIDILAFMIIRKLFCTRLFDSFDT